MGAKDIKTKEYLRDNDRFADLCNYVLYKGRQVINPKDLQEQDVIELLSMHMDSDEENVQKWRDILKRAVVKSTDVATYILLGIENQSEIHYAMPVKALMYDALNYSAQVKSIAKSHRKRKDAMTKAEFLSEFKKEDKITPIITITLYWGLEEFEQFQTTLGPTLKFLNMQVIWNDLKK